MFQNYSI